MENINEMSAERSIEIIKKYIDLSRKGTEKNAGLPMIIWGGLCIVTALIVGHLWNTTGNPVWNFLWFVMALVGWAYMYWLARKEKLAKQPRTFISTIMGNIWYSFGIFASTLPILMYAVMPFFGTGHLGFSYTPVIILMLGVCGTATGLILRNGWIVAGCIVGGLVGTIMADLVRGPQEMLVLAGVAVVTMLIPGIMINWRKDHV